MKFSCEGAEVFVPDGIPDESALRRTTHLCISAHQDDIEIMAAQPILECFQSAEKWFTGVVMTDGRGSPRTGLYESYTDDEMRSVRWKEQRKAAVVGEYSAQVFLDHPSKTLKDSSRGGPVDDLQALICATSPGIIFTHNLADKHDTHVATALRVIQALRNLQPQERPARLIGCEVWRALDWVVDTDKLPMDLSGGESLQRALLGVFDSQIAGGKRYDLASIGRRRANATYYESHGVDQATALSYGIDMSPLLDESGGDPLDFIQAFIERFSEDVGERIRKLK